MPALTASWPKGLWEPIRLSECGREKGVVKGWVVCPLVMNTLGSPTSGGIPLEVLVYGDINMIDVDSVKETKAVVFLSSRL